MKINNLLNSLNSPIDKIESVERNFVQTTEFMLVSNSRKDVQRDLFNNVFTTSDRITESNKITNKNNIYKYFANHSAYSNEYLFFRTMSKELLCKYLDKSLFMMHFSHDSWVGTPPSPKVRNPTRDTDPNVHSKGMAMIKDLKPKMVVLAGIWNANKGGSIYGTFNTISADIKMIHEYDADVICGADIMECIDFGYNNNNPELSVYHSDFIIPWYVLKEFGYRYEDPYSKDVYNTSNPHRNFSNELDDRFDSRLMQYSKTSAPDRHHINSKTGKPFTYYELHDICNPDFSKTETQMWFYFMATGYINCGCECLQLGDIFVMTDFDGLLGNHSLWSLMRKIRNYAYLYARRGLVLLEGRYHVDGVEVYYFDPEPRFPLYGKPDRQLLFDYISGGVPLYQLSGSGSSIPCTSDYAPAQLRKEWALENPPRGKHPLGWITNGLPIRLQLDQGGWDNNPVGCGYGEFNTMQMYHWQNVSWFVAQSEEYRNKILKYLYYKIKCFGGFFMFPGREVEFCRDNNCTYIDMLGNRINVSDEYNAYNGSGNQQSTIKNIWSGLYATKPEWTPHNFTIESVFNGLNNSYNCLIFVDVDKIFFIGIDGYIHGWVHIDDVWLGVSPTYASAMQFGTGTMGFDAQVKAQSDLVSSPDGKRLLYLGVDGRFYGFDIIDIWTYKYTGEFMPTDPWHRRSIVQKSLIYPGDDRIYYIEKMSDSSQRVHGFQKSSGSWQPVSPSYSADYNYGSTEFNQQISHQFQAAGSLTYDNSVFPNRIYFRSTDGYLGYFDVYNLIDYKFVNCIVNSHLIGQRLKIVGQLALNKNRIYYVALYQNSPSLTDSYRVHCMIDDGAGYWRTDSPTYEVAGTTPWIGVSSQLRSDHQGQISVSEDGKWIAYLSEENRLCLYSYDGGVSYDYVPTSISNELFVISKCLQFRGNKELFYIRKNNKSGSEFDWQVVQVKYEENYCHNPQIQLLPYAESVV